MAVELVGRNRTLLVVIVWYVASSSNPVQSALPTIIYSRFPVHHLLAWQSGANFPEIFIPSSNDDKLDFAIHQPIPRSPLLQFIFPVLQSVIPALQFFLWLW